jgi:hypothetical protein
MPRKLDVTDAALAAADWRSATKATGRSNQVEVARVDDGYAMRSSEHPDGPILLFTVAEWDAFVAGVRDGEFDG